MPVYLIDFETMLKYTTEKTTEDHRGLYWETSSQFVIEYPVMNNAGQSMGFVFRCEVDKINLKTALTSLDPVASIETLDAAIKAFENMYLINRFVKVLGRV